MDVKPRKLPRQTRAQATVGAIVEASTQLLLESGYDRFTTARVAERAGVSVGSLYQYFPNKAALASAVIERCCIEFLVTFDAALAGRRGATLKDCIRAMVEVSLVSHHLTAELHRIVIDLAPRIGVQDKAAQISKMVTARIEAMLRTHANEIAPDIDIATAAILIETILEALAHRAALGHAAHLEGNVLADEATRLVTNYLTVIAAGHRSSNVQRSW